MYIPQRASELEVIILDEHPKEESWIRQERGMKGAPGRRKNERLKQRPLRQWLEDGLE